MEDCDTMASIIQRKINEIGINYRIVNFSMGGAQIWEQINRLLEIEIGNNDIIIGIVNKMFISDAEHTILFDSDEVANYLEEEEYWDLPMHCGVKGYNILAAQIFEKIKLELCSHQRKNFALKADLEMEVKSYITNVKNKLKKEHKNLDSSTHSKAGAIVMNCNPFTYGHQYLVETASRLVDVLYIFVVEEDKSVFPFSERIHMVEEGTKKFANVIVLPSGRFMISSVTFPGYFMKENPSNKCYDSFLDLKIFAHYIAPAMNITMRFVGEEPFDRVTEQYNHDMKLILGNQGINVIEIPRKKYSDEIISATKVRQFINEKNMEKLLCYVPDSTMACIKKLM